MPALARPSRSKTTHKSHSFTSDGESGPASRLMCGTCCESGLAESPARRGPALPLVVGVFAGGDGGDGTLFAGRAPGSSARSRNSGWPFSGPNGPALDRPATTLLASPRWPSFRDLRIAVVEPLTVCVLPVSSLYARYHWSDACCWSPAAGTRRVLRPVRSSTNSRHDTGRLSGSALIARRIAQSTRSEMCGTSCLGGISSLPTFFIQASSGPLERNGSSLVTIMYSVAPSE